MREITFGDFLAGGGGMTHAMKELGGKVKWVLNHDRVAIRTNMHNHKGIKHYLANFYTQDEREMEPVDFAWVSIECTQHTPALGGRERKIGSYMLGWELLRYLVFMKPFVIGIENVPEFKKWSPLRIRENKKLSTNEYSALKTKKNKEGSLNYEWEPNRDKLGQEFEAWKKSIMIMGYDYHENINNAADYGIPTRRVRYFAFFTKKELHMKVKWPSPTHSKDGKNGLKRWVACKSYINLHDEGESIFGREFNPRIKKGKRKPLCPNTLKRIAGGIPKYAPDLAFIFHYYSNGTTSQSLRSPLNTITTKDRHVLVSMEKMHFIADHCHTDKLHSLEEPIGPQTCRQTKQLISADKIHFVADHCHQDHYNGSDDPMTPTLTWQTKQLITVENKMMVQHYSGIHASDIDSPLPSITTVDHNALVSGSAQFLLDYYGRSDTAQSLEKPANAIRCENSKHLASCSFISNQYNSNGNPSANNQSVEEPLSTITTGRKHQFISHQFGSGINQSIDNPMHAITTKEKIQFITAYYSSSGKPGSQNQSLDDPLNAITTGTNKQALVTAIESGELDFDIKMRFLEPEELSSISTFPRGYFTDPLLKLTKKEATRLIGNAVPPDWGMMMLKPVYDELKEKLEELEL